MSKIKGRFEDIVADFLPENSLEEVVRLWNETPYVLSVTRNRKTKKGDFRPDNKFHFHRISVNGTLNPYEFLLVLIHEYAHLMVWKKYRAKVKPHGEEWKNEFRTYMLPFFELVNFPPTLGIALLNYMRNPKASSGADVQLQREFSKFDAPSNSTLVEDLKDGDVFVFNNSLFKREKKLRKRYLCEEIHSKRKYRFSPTAAVEIFVEKMD